MGRPKGAKNKPKQKSDLESVFYELMATPEVTSEDLLKLWALKYVFTRRDKWPMMNKGIDSTIWSRNMEILQTLKCEPW